MALTPKANATLTQVGKGTPGGELLRRYWMPIAPVAEITPERPKKRLRVERIRRTLAPLTAKCGNDAFSEELHRLHVEVARHIDKLVVEE